ncbi:hypothetical protein OSB04_000189 [Centaurea solstitialis]|uniref:Uncharacterized protein n=1 Tax=Centaurea solstitialis TaxID=347529 RepID=A0AA38TNK9_9ASTR|nr:hypothetical protein OSB04_000189 [Centaurea solstitialis]
MEADLDPSNLHLHDDNLTEQIDRFISSSSSSTSPPPPDDNQILQFIQCFALLFEEEVVQYESGTKKWTQDESTSLFLVSVERTSKLLHSLSRFQSQKEGRTAALFNQISGTHQRAMSFMEDEFKSILDDFQTSRDRDQKNNTDPDQIPASSPTDDQSSQPEDQQTVVDDYQDNFLGYSDETVSDLKS